MDDSTAVDGAELFPPLPVPEELAVAAKQKGWPDGLLQRLVDLRAPRWELDDLLGADEIDFPAIERRTRQREELAFGKLRARKADVSDAEQFAEVWANSPQDLGDWTVTVERSPNPFAQWRLQENVVLNVLIDRGLMVACQGNSRRNVLVGGERFTASLIQAMRVRKEFRRREYSQLVAGGGGGPHPNTPFDSAGYMYVRSENLSAYAWMQAMNPEAFTAPPDDTGNVPGVDVSVLMIPAEPQADDGREAAGPPVVRKATEDDLRACVAMINRTHRGLDLFRPYTVDFLANRLDEGSWAPKVGWNPHVYGWDEFFVVEGAGRVVACGGLWDRGRDTREIWRKKDGTEERTVDATALLDFGYARGRLDAAERLVEFFLGETHALGRSHMLAALQFQPALARRLRHRHPVVDRRRIQWWTAQDAPQVQLTKPYTDLGYW